MRENPSPDSELVNEDCAAVLPGPPPAGLILTSPPYDNLREYGGYNAAFDFDATAAACPANHAPGEAPVGWLATRSLTAAKAARVSGRRWRLRFCCIRGVVRG